MQIPSNHDNEYLHKCTIFGVYSVVQKGMALKVEAMLNSLHVEGCRPSNSNLSPKCDTWCLVQFLCKPQLLSMMLSFTSVVG
jgi:hypothetical protein